jgi:hypothetical protein
LRHVFSLKKVQSLWSKKREKKGSDIAAGKKEKPTLGIFKINVSQRVPVSRIPQALATLAA